MSVTDEQLTMTPREVTTMIRRDLATFGIPALSDEQMRYVEEYIAPRMFDEAMVAEALGDAEATDKEAEEVNRENASFIRIAESAVRRLRIIVNTDLDDGQAVQEMVSLVIDELEEIG